LKNNLNQLIGNTFLPDYFIIHEEHDFVFLNPKGNEVIFDFDEIFDWIYNDNYIGCGTDCDRCLTPIC